jgi:alpha-D-xyloside xylohydrolase
VYFSLLSFPFVQLLILISLHLCHPPPAQYGFKTVWLDASEPEHFGSANEGNWRFTAGSDAEIGEAWVREHVKTFADGFASKGIMPGDYFVLPRHAWAGTWRYSAGLWSGDIQSSFDVFSEQIKNLQGAAMSGVVLLATDTGGYFGGNPEDPEFQELIVRWFQFSAFCPLFRLHGHRDGGPPANECGPTNGDNEGK